MERVRKAFVVFVFVLSTAFGKDLHTKEKENSLERSLVVNLLNNNDIFTKHERQPSMSGRRLFALNKEQDGYVTIETQVLRPHKKRRFTVNAGCFQSKHLGVWAGLGCLSRGGGQEQHSNTDIPQQ
ncbi:hypothetical protein MSG28_014277 [Choristoneura fumiferana]|uniref:Uncharacterized protein n=1 Tax=Choristoneura fumiferana TaxID=7141 RepID=A0ACC0JGH3_CHOFU|nr:hypothetical protein MSG28_014277 [Choristoneura fumiferana]